jgi:hypothetical protein
MSRRCDCKCNRVKQPVIINNNIYVPQPQQPSGGGGSSVGVGAPSGATAPQTQTYTLTSSQYSWTIAPMPNPYTPGNSILVVIPSGMANPAQFIQQLVNATQVSVTISLNFIASLSNLVSGSTEPKSTTYMQDADMSAVSGGTSTLTAVTRTVDTNTISGTTNINFIEYNDEGYISSLTYYGSITGVTLTITYAP